MSTVFIAVMLSVNGPVRKVPVLSLCGWGEEEEVEGVEREEPRRRGGERGEGRGWWEGERRAELQLQRTKL